MTKTTSFSFAALGAAVVMLGATATALAQSPRSLPPDSRLARMTYSGDMTVIVDGYAAALTMGAQIRNEQNLIIVPSALPNLSLVRYTADHDGRIDRVWVVRADEVEMSVQTTGKLQRQ